MKGKHKIEVRSKRIVFTIELERNITILRGDSATGKTTLVEMLSAYENYGRKSGVTIVCDKTCRVLSGALWEAQLKDIQDTIVFVDEGSTFVSSLDFARAIQKTDNYYVLVTREDLSTLPYSVNAILELKKTTSRFKRTYNKAYPIYSHWCFWPFPLSIQFHTLLFVLIAVFHKNTPNTGCPVLGVHISFCDRKPGRFFALTEGQMKNTV